MTRSNGSLWTPMDTCNFFDRLIDIKKQLIYNASCTWDHVAEFG